MSTSYSAALVYGLPYKLADELIDNLDDLIDSGKIEILPPYYGASRRESLVGVGIQNSGDYGYRVFKPEDLPGEQKAELTKQITAVAELFGQGNVEYYLTTVVY